MSSADAGAAAKLAATARVEITNAFFMIQTSFQHIAEVQPFWRVRRPVLPALLITQTESASWRGLDSF
jgi:hypothetical protein